MQSLTPSKLKRPDNRLATQIVKQCIRAQDTSTEAAQIDAAVGYAVHEYIMRINPAVARDQRFRHSISTIQILAPDAVR